MKRLKHWTASAAILGCTMLVFGLISDWWRGLPFMDAEGFRMGAATLVLAFLVMVPIGIISAIREWAGRRESGRH